MPFARVNDTELYYEVADFTQPWVGEAETLVFLHGLHGHMGWWHWFQTAFFAHHVRVITVDQRSHGRSFKPATGYTIPAMAADVRDLLESLGVRRAHLCGASMGGMVALQVALVYPELVRSLVLVDSYPHTPEVIKNAIEVWVRDTAERGYPAVMATFNDDYADALFSHEFRQRRPEFPRYETKLVLDNLMPDAAFIGCCRAIQEFNVADRLGEIAAPVLIVTSNAGMAYAESLRMHEQLPNAQIWAPPHVGHSPHVEIPEQFNQRVLEFLQSI